MEAPKDISKKEETVDSVALEKDLELNSKSLKELIKQRSKLLLTKGLMKESFKALDVMERMFGNVEERRDIYIEYLISLQQVDDLIPYLSRTDITLKPEYIVQIKELMARHDKENKFSLTDPEMVKHIEFTRWVKENGGEIRKTKMLVYAKDYRGLHATANIEDGEEIVTIPYKLAVSSVNFENTEIGKKMTEQKTFNEKWTLFMYPIIFIMDELLNPKSFYQKWIDVIPHECTEHPMFFSPEEEKWLAGSSALDQLQIDKRLVESFYRKIEKVDPSFAKRHTMKRFLEYYFLLCSRFFGVHANNDKLTLLVPYADLINTGNTEDRNASWDFNSDTQEFQIKAVKPIKRDEVIQFSYGHNSNFTYFTYYGITLEYPEYDSFCYILKFNESVAHHKLKAELINQDLTMSKKTKFFHDFEKRMHSNRSFISKCRYYWYEGDPTLLYTSVRPEAEKSPNFKRTKRSILFKPTTASFEEKVLNNILKIAKESITRYTSTVEEDEKALKSPGLPYHHICSIRIVLGEKKSLRALIDMIENVLKLLNHETKNQARKHYASWKRKPIYKEYIEEDILSLDWKQPS
eukprot:TRINITY_DN1189_c0_g1_i1.p1 TRINITY_DN1189_c0_g1~~TRINITY_DN1189_c0_g1_i1.p1  ORF type:complete len:578 (+),score=110.36 TRINITY_DN1189_c0_g1_i1:24-1757(+)